MDNRLKRSPESEALAHYITLVITGIVIVSFWYMFIKAWFNIS